MILGNPRKEDLILSFVNDRKKIDDYLDNCYEHCMSSNDCPYFSRNDCIKELTKDYKKYNKIMKLKEIKKI